MVVTECCCDLKFASEFDIQVTGLGVGSCKKLKCSIFFGGRAFFTKILDPKKSLLYPKQPKIAKQISLWDVLNNCRDKKRKHFPDSRT